MLIVFVDRLYSHPAIVDYFNLDLNLKKLAWYTIFYEADVIKDHFNKMFDNIPTDLFTIEDAMTYLVDTFEANEYYEGAQAVKDCCIHYEIELMQ